MLEPLSARQAALMRSVAACVLFAVPICAGAWGEEGHEIIGHIAWREMTPRARADAAQLLQRPDLDAAGFAAETLWADRWRDSNRTGAKVHYDATREWHYVDVELRRPDLAAACFGHAPLPDGVLASAGPAHACIVDKIEQFRVELADASLPTAERAQSLRFLMHFIGDLHQPLHAGDDLDRGGNDKRVFAAGFRAGTLHYYWDSVFVGRLGENSAAVAQAVAADSTSRERSAWRAGTSAEWAMESFRLAHSVAYGRLPAPTAGGGYELGDDYINAATAAVRLQLARAGVRLAWFLNQALDPAAPVPARRGAGSSR
jgi:hypothetical protein